MRGVEGGRFETVVVCPIKDSVTKVELSLFVYLRWSQLTCPSLVVCTCNDTMMASGTRDVTVCTQEEVTVYATTAEIDRVGDVLIAALFHVPVENLPCTRRVSVRFGPSGIGDCSTCSVSPRLLAHPPRSPGTHV